MSDVALPTLIVAPVSKKARKPAAAQLQEAHFQENVAVTLSVHPDLLLAVRTYAHTHPGYSTGEKVVGPIAPPGRSRPSSFVLKLCAQQKSALEIYLVPVSDKNRDGTQKEDF